MARPNPYDARERAESHAEDSTELLDKVGRALTGMWEGIGEDSGEPAGDVSGEESVAMVYVFAVVAVVFGAVGVAARSWVSFVAVACVLAIGVVWLSRRSERLDARGPRRRKR